MFYRLNLLGAFSIYDELTGTKVKGSSGFEEGTIVLRVTSQKVFPEHTLQPDLLN